MTNIKIYSTPNCVFCKKAKDFFQSMDLPYAEFNVAEDAAARDEMFAKTGKMSVPVIEINNKITIGFNEQEIRNLLSPKQEVFTMNDPMEDTVCDSCQ